MRLFLVPMVAAAAALTVAGCDRTAADPSASAPPADAQPAAESAPDATAVAVADGEASAQATPAASPAGGGPRGPGDRRFDGPMTLADMQARALRGFERQDANGDGVVTADELSNEGEGRGGGRMLERADADGDGRITRAEAEAAAAERFRAMDRNGDGVVSEDERPSFGPGGPGGRRDGPPAPN